MEAAYPSCPSLDGTRHPSVDWMCRHFSQSPIRPPACQTQDPLEVDRFTPSGPVDWVPRIHIVFSKPMVPLSSHAALAEHIPEVSLSPSIEGEWQWQGTQTLLFQLSEPPVGSTRYEVKVAPGIASLDHSNLEAGFTGTFETPRLQLESTWPHRDATLRLEPYLVLRFSQSINARELLSYLSLKAGSSLVGFELISLTDPSLPEQVQEVLTRGAPERSLVLKPSAPLSPDTTYTLSIARAHLLQSDRYARWRSNKQLGKRMVSSKLPGLVAAPVIQVGHFILNFSNQLDTDSLRDGMVSIKPDLPDGAIHISPNGIWLTGSTAPDTVYTLRIGPGLTDVYGQALSQVVEQRFRVAKTYQEPTEALHFPNFVEVLHPNDGGKYSIFTRDLDQLEIALYQVTPAGLG